MLDPVDQLRSALSKIDVGGVHVYHRGFLVIDRYNRPQLNRLATLVFGLRLAGAVELSQKKLEEGLYEYRLRVIRAIRNSDFDRAFTLVKQHAEEHS